MTTRIDRRGIAAILASVVAVSGAAFSQSSDTLPAAAAPAGPRTTMDQSAPGHDRPGMGAGPGTGGMPPHGSDMMQMHARMAGAMPRLPGQDAFGAIQEIVRLLETDPNTDWSKVDLEALRQHLIDMEEVTLKADAESKPVDGGIAIAVTGSGRTLAAIQRMVPAHAKEIDGRDGWNAKATLLPNGVLLTVTSNDPKSVPRIRGLGFIGILVTGAHHQAHHLAMAKGEFAQAH